MFRRLRPILMKMDVTALRPVPTSPSVETLQELIRALTTERQDLRARAAAHDDLERNRIELVRAQQELARALIRRYLPAA
jgi:hypothetical protein